MEGDGAAWEPMQMGQSSGRGGPVQVKLKYDSGGRDMEFAQHSCRMSQLPALLQQCWSQLTTAGIVGGKENLHRWDAHQPKPLITSQSHPLPKA